MNEKGLTTINLKQINKSKVYQYVYREKETSKLQIVQELQMGLSTVSQNLNVLEEQGLIERNGFLESTGGRKAQAIHIVSDFKISIGVGILKDMFHITAVNLYGDVIYRDTVSLSYSDTPAYYKSIADAIMEFIKENHYEEKTLGISFATQGITSQDNTVVTYGKIMDNTGMNVNNFSEYLPYPCPFGTRFQNLLPAWNYGIIQALIML